MDEAVKTAATFRVEGDDLGMRSWMISHEGERPFDTKHENIIENIDFAVLGGTTSWFRKSP